ncbi:hypothetical protein, partial [Brevibacillus borstelensis]|uniref:hypothetical protein n=1 Tax=Brevibacillus borstelensis TaxID=45462 RepID=UPI0030BABE14
MKKFILASTVSLMTVSSLFVPNMLVNAKEERSEKNTLIKEKMLNSIQFYEDVRGSFKHVTPNRDIIVEFEVQEGNKPYSHVKVKDKGGLIKETISDETRLISLYNKEKTYKKTEKAPIKPEKVKM